MICFNCGRQGHKEDACDIAKNAHSDEAPQQVDTRLDKADNSKDVKERTYGNWMLVKKPARRTNGRNQATGARSRGQPHGEQNNSRSRGA